MHTALLRVNVIAGMCLILVLLDLSTTFDTVEHEILLDRLRHGLGIAGTALNCFSSYVSINNFMQNFFHIDYGVPQDSILGPILFFL